MKNSEGLFLNLVIRDKLIAVCLGCLLFSLVGGCATERWCNDLNDYSTLEADLDHCKRESGFLGQVLPGSLDDCMRSFGWKPCFTDQTNGD